MSDDQDEKDKKNELLREEKVKEHSLKTQSRTGFKWKAWNILCGISGSPMDIDEKDMKEVDEEKVKKASAVDDPKWQKIAAVNGIVLAGVCAFLFGYYA